jgi:hypothetical protein
LTGFWNGCTLRIVAFLSFPRRRGIAGSKPKRLTALGMRIVGAEASNPIRNSPVLSAPESGFRSPPAPCEVFEFCVTIEFRCLSRRNANNAARSSEEGFTGKGAIQGFAAAAVACYLKGDRKSSQRLNAKGHSRLSTTISSIMLEDAGRK